MDVPRIEAMLAQWEQVPPVAAMVAAYCGYKPPTRKKPDGPRAAGPRNSPEAIEELKRMFPSGAIR